MFHNFFIRILDITVLGLYSLHRDVKAINEIMSEFSRRFYLSKFKVLFSFMCLRGSPISTLWNYACYCNGKTNISHQAMNNTRLLAGVGFPIVGGDFLLRTGRVMKSPRATVWWRPWWMAGCRGGEVEKGRAWGLKAIAFRADLWPMSFLGAGD